MPHTRPIERKLTTILAADAANYSGRMARDEEATVRALRAARAVTDDAIAHAQGRIVNTSGDGLIAEFPSVVAAVRCAITIQTTLNRDGGLLPFRVGIHLDDVIVEGDDLLGDGVNLAARLQEMADVGGILVSQQVHDHVRGKIGQAALRPLGPATPRHLDEVGLYAVIVDGVVAPRMFDNLGPRVTTAPAPPPDQIGNADAVALRRAYVRTRKHVWIGIVALAVFDVATGVPFLVTTVPTLGLGYLLFDRWRKLRIVEKRMIAR